MSNIEILSSEIANQIAAGEVVENPTSVVKECVENSIDAGAAQVDIVLEEAGKKFLGIYDDGKGMGGEDLEKSILRHATSKLRKIEDLFAIGTFGFRGEALAAITSVGKCKISSCESGSDFGKLLEISGGKVEKISEKISMNQGTRIEVEDLFYTTPARREYLRSDASEYRDILREVKKFALANFSVGFSLTKDGKKVFDIPKVGDAIVRVAQVLKKISGNLLEVESVFPGVKVWGFIGRPEEAVANKNSQFLFVNGRAIDDFKVGLAVRQAYQNTCGMEKHLHPIFVLFVEVDPILVDVNVHPRKREVKFSEPQDVFRCTVDACERGLRDVGESVGTSTFTSSFGQSPKSPLTTGLDGADIKVGQPQGIAPMGNFSGGKSPLAPLSQRGGQSSFLGKSFGEISAVRDLGASTPHPTSPSGRGDINSFNLGRKILEEESPFAENSVSIGESGRGVFQKSFEEQELGELRLIGQSGRKYILAENDAGLFIFDQHALHERQRFEKYWKIFHERKISPQKLLLSEKLRFLDEEILLFAEHKKAIEDLGFVIDFPADDILEILAVPNILESENLGEFFEDFVKYLQEDKLSEHGLQKFMREKIEYKACRGSIMFGDVLSRKEMQHILDDLKNTQFKWLCAHGRPHYQFFPFADLDRGFHR